MSELATLARPYAAAVFKRGKETGSIEQWSQKLTYLNGVLSDANMSAVIDNPKVNKQQLSELLVEICQGQIDQEGENFLKLLAHHGRLALLPFIIRLFEEYRAQEEGYVDVDVSVAYEFTDDTWRHFVQALEKRLGKSARIKVTVDRSLIGGVLVRAGDKVIDGTIKGRLQHMRNTLK